MVKVGEIRKWNYDDTDVQCFAVKKYKSYFLDEHYYIIKYLTDGREQTVSETSLLSDSKEVTME